MTNWSNNKEQLIYFFVDNLIITMREGDFISNRLRKKGC